MTQVRDIELKIQEAREKGRVTASDLVAAAQNELALLKSKTTIKIQLDFEQQRAEAHERTVRAIEATDDPLQQQLANQRFFLDLQILSGREQNALNEAAQETDSLFKSVKDTVATGLANAMEGLIFQTKSLSESLAGLAKSLASMFLQAGMPVSYWWPVPKRQGKRFCRQQNCPLCLWRHCRQAHAVPNGEWRRPDGRGRP